MRLKGYRATLAAVAIAALVVPALVAPVADGVAGTGALTLRLTAVATGFQKLTFATPAHDGTDRLFVVEQRGMIHVVDGGVRDPTPYLDLRGKIGSNGWEQGLLGVAFDPDFAANGRFFVSYTDKRGDSAIERFTVADPANGRPNANAGTVILELDQPYSNHNGGHIAFGPDGYLYVGFGDGGSAGDPRRHGANPFTLLGTLLRLDVSGNGYAIPADNPFADGAQGAPEVWAYGLRNPWRYSFDRDTGDLWIADVGQNLMEEVNRVPGNAAGLHYGWNYWEGHLPYRTDARPNGMTFPIIEYPQNLLHCSITGGFVYRGEAIPALQGQYLYADYCSGAVWAAREVSGQWVSDQVMDTSLNPTSFGETADGELMLVHQNGIVYRIDPGLL